MSTPGHNRTEIAPDHWKHRQKWSSVAKRKEALRRLPGMPKVSSKEHPYYRYTVRTQEEVAQILGCTRSNVWDAEGFIKGT